MIKALKKITIKGKEYFLDERLKELRGVKDLETIKLNDFEVEYYKNQKPHFKLLLTFESTEKLEEFQEALNMDLRNELENESGIDKVEVLENAVL